ncbi:type II toxin-antitoxin system Phd/YefM family antitoxin [Niabella ginsengisoli]|uniref:Type II toxin-antitoxin system Phd/YefM family antitoxin n=1 Tax=Niabella ginsengisoli TaxID=522298 RepID=A0ABS9SL35_9BACT|nr:type II toxin-antitoxin system Phd/YefM family antitoxin [Niabella ginsengisoli]MCH5599098.1 type II toxin-antitoxin system Phd/YefM family antitoxin [Niabella ginsengisoli]
MSYEFIILMKRIIISTVKNKKKASIISVTQFRDNLKSFLDRAKSERIIVHNSKGSFAIVPLDDAEIDITYNKEWVTTMRKSVNEAKAGKLTNISVNDLWK